MQEKFQMTRVIDFYSRLNYYLINETEVCIVGVIINLIIFCCNKQWVIKGNKRENTPFLRSLLTKEERVDCFMCFCLYYH